MIRPTIASVDTVFLAWLLVPRPFSHQNRGFVSSVASFLGLQIGLKAIDLGLVPSRKTAC